MFPLTGVRVLDLSRVLAGPFCTMILGDLGADVIKVESFDGDETRRYEPVVNGASCYFLAFNRNKRSIAVNLKTESGREIVRRLAREADVLVENFRYGTMEKWGLGYETLKAENPGLIYCAVSAFGRSGPLKELPGYDLMMQAFSGLMSVTGIEDGPPVRTGWSITDLTAGMWAAIGILSALFERKATGEGRMIETSLFEGQLGLMTYYATTYLITGEVGKRLGASHFSIAPYQAFETVDGYVIIAAPNDGLFARLCNVLGVPQLAEQDRYKTNALRVQHRRELAEELQGLVGAFTTEKLLELLREAGVPCAPIHTIDQVLQHEQTLAREMVVTSEYPGIGSFRMTRSPLQPPAEAHKTVRLRPPLLSEHAEEILASVGYADKDIKLLHQEGAVLLPKSGGV
ncbi:L-carnitine dehydratase/bile acid-inducible protein F [Kyrpidia tusciae DSM 2912]|uniref:L-carnitine dehydratase/bile acid-inducible protein F n=1 Tax=Kyrpidia tusciae (strain DSM 2912 / NBRC 15312 / T2) TaxID=562970 RepID=D5WXR9_KYRT2|nr:L-carnitine dehydratase/bile acid-inducible protein F [Kyrpidia tusciae DSM 2912]